MDRAVSTTMRTRKVIYDDYTHAFYVETRVEALERQVATRAKLTDVLNRSHETRLRNHKKQVDAEKDIFEKKNDRKTSFHKEHLKDQVAHRHVLDGIARSRHDSGSGNRSESHLGHYGLGASKLDIQPLIEQNIKENTSSAKRKRQSMRIQSKRRGVNVFDRTKTTSALLRMKPQVKSRPTSEDVKATQAEEQATKQAKQLILPPITVRWARHHVTEDKGETLQGTRYTGGGDRNGDSTLPTVFVTQGRH
ncbi:uncharacterized protein [Littorina saxatilis]|uniref:Uncharacterized protein n=1 Tax=Littorina saxatilis TaxID=31220 RepID=A0AAN9GB16_9CAEN